MAVKRLSKAQWEAWFDLLRERQLFPIPSGFQMKTTRMSNGDVWVVESHNGQRIALGSTNKQGDIVVRTPVYERFIWDFPLGRWQVAGLSLWNDALQNLWWRITQVFPDARRINENFDWTADLYGHFVAHFVVESLPLFPKVTATSTQMNKAILRFHRSIGEDYKLNLEWSGKDWFVVV